MRAELQHLFCVDLDDVWDGKVRVRHAVYLLGQAANYGDSLLRSDELGTVWTPTVQAIAILHDMIAGALAGDKFTDENRFPRPKLRDASVPTNDDGHELYAPTLADMIQRGAGNFMNRVMNPA